MSSFLENLSQQAPLQRASKEAKGLPAGAVTALAKQYGVSTEEMCVALGMSRATWQRAKAARKPLPRDVSESIVRFSVLYMRAARQLRDVPRWMHARTPYLGNESAFDVMQTESGGQAVALLLDRLETAGPA